jgi:hypothetical protein
MLVSATILKSHNMTTLRICNCLHKCLKTGSIAFVVTAFIMVAMAFPNHATADVVLALDTAGSTTIDTGVAGSGKLLRIYISSDSADEIQALNTPFTIEAGDVTSGLVSTSGATGTAGFFGAGNLTNSDFVRTSGSTFVVDQFLTAPQNLLDAANRELWFELTIDTTGVASGSYFLRLDDPNSSFFDSGANALTPNNNLTFSVSAVPEPGSLSVIGLASVLLITRRRRTAG